MKRRAAAAVWLLLALAYGVPILLEVAAGDPDLAPSAWIVALLGAAGALIWRGGPLGRAITVAMAILAVLRGALVLLVMILAPGLASASTADIAREVIVLAAVLVTHVAALREGGGRLDPRRASEPPSSTARQPTPTTTGPELPSPPSAVGYRGAPDAHGAAPVPEATGSGPGRRTRLLERVGRLIASAGLAGSGTGALWFVGLHLEWRAVFLLFVAAAVAASLAAGFVGRGAIGLVGWFGGAVPALWVAGGHVAVDAFAVGMVSAGRLLVLLAVAAVPGATHRDRTRPAARPTGSAARSYRSWRGVMERVPGGLEVARHERRWCPPNALVCGTGPWNREAPTG